MLPGARCREPTPALERTVVELEAYVVEVRRTVESAGDDPVAAALDATGRASVALDEARLAAAGLDADVAAELEERFGLQP